MVKLNLTMIIADLKNRINWLKPPDQSDKHGPQ